MALDWSAPLRGCASALTPGAAAAGGCPGFGPYEPPAQGLGRAEGALGMSLRVFDGLWVALNATCTATRSGERRICARLSGALEVSIAAAAAHKKPLHPTQQHHTHTSAHTHKRTRTEIQKTRARTRTRARKNNGASPPQAHLPGAHLPAHGRVARLHVGGLPPVVRFRSLSLTHTRIVMIGKRGKGGEGENRWAVMLCCVVHVWVLVLRCSGP